MDEPLVSCLMITRDRIRLAERAVICFERQTWQNKELVIVDDGEVDYWPMLERYAERCIIRYHKQPKGSLGSLGEARNFSLEHAMGDFLIQWDDDEWYHPQRIAVQMVPTKKGADAVVLRHTLMHLDHSDFVRHPYRTQIRIGTPGTILHRKSSIRYPALSRREDSVYLYEWRKQGKTVVLPNCAHLFMRCYHGTNTWDGRHFLERLNKSPINRLHYLIAKHYYGDILKHRAFRLNEQELLAARDYLEDSKSLRLFSCA